MSTARGSLAPTKLLLAGTEDGLGEGVSGGGRPAVYPCQAPTIWLHSDLRRGDGLVEATPSHPFADFWRNSTNQKSKMN